MKPPASYGLFSKLSRLLPGRSGLSSIGELLSQSISSEDLAERMMWFENILLWLKKEDVGSEARFKYFFQILEKNPQWKEEFRKTFCSLLTDCSFLTFFTQTGYANEHGLWTDIAGRLSDLALPSGGSGEFREMISNVFRTEQSCDWILRIPDPILEQFRVLLFSSSDDYSRVERAIREAVLVLSASVAHHGTGIDIRNRLDSASGLEKSSFLHLGFGLGRSVQKLLLDSEALNNDSDSFESDIKRCHQDVELVYKSMEQSGVSVAVVHKLEVLSISLEKVESLLNLEVKLPPVEKSKLVRDFLASSARAGVRGRSIRNHIRRHFYLLSRKIVERNGQSGEHYIAKNRSEFYFLFKSAIGGGVIVVAMTILKTLVLRMSMAPLFEALGVSFVYSAGFLAMQFTGNTLATKIPSFTASHLARKLNEARTNNNTQGFVHEAVLIFKSQATALLGNFIGVIPLAILLHFISTFLFHGHSLMGPAYAEHTLEELNPVMSFAVLLGALTGLELWLSSVCGGWFENWIVFKGIPQSIVRHPRLRQVFGEARAKELSSQLLVHSSGFAANIALGFLFGFVPFIGSIIGLGLEGKHVTISTAGATFAVSALHFDLPLSKVLFMFFGLILIGLMNFAVSFLLALVVAIRAQNVDSSWAWRFFKSSFFGKRAAVR